MRRIIIPFSLSLLFIASSLRLGSGSATLRLGSGSATAHAATFRSGDALSIAAPVMDDLYATGRNMSIQGDVGGDLFVAGESVNIQNRVLQGLNVAGRNVKVQSDVGNDVRAAGADVEIRGTIRGDLLAAGGNVMVGNDAVVLGDVWVYSGNATLRGPVGRNLKVRGGTVILEGIFHGDLDVEAESVLVAGPVEGNARIVADRITVEPGASFKGSVDYWARNRRTDFGGSLASGQSPVFHPEYARMTEKSAARGALAGIFSAWMLYSILAGALVLLVLLLATKTLFIDAARQLRRRPWWSLLVGVLFFVATPIIALLLLFTLIGFPLTILLMAAYAITVLFALPVSSMVLARWIEITGKKKWENPAVFGVALGIFVALKLIGFVPIVGWSLKAVLVFFAIGAYLLTKTAKWKKVR